MTNAVKSNTKLLKSVYKWWIIVRQSALEYINISQSNGHITVCVNKKLTDKLVYTIQMLWSKLCKPISIRKYHSDESYKNATMKINNVLCEQYFATLDIIYDLEQCGMPQGGIRWDAIYFNYMFLIPLSFSTDPVCYTLPESDMVWFYSGSY